MNKVVNKVTVFLLKLSNIAAVYLHNVNDRAQSKIIKTEVGLALIKAAAQQSSDEMREILSENKDFFVSDLFACELADVAIDNDSSEVIVFLASRSEVDLGYVAERAIQLDKLNVLQACLDNARACLSALSVKHTCMKYFQSASKDVQKVLLANNIKPKEEKR